MLPIFRIVAGGGVFLAILILALALTPPDRARLPLPQHLVAERGALIDRDEHPEWRQFLIRAALLRANEIERLRDLPDAPIRVAPEATSGPQTKAEPTVKFAPERQVEAKPEKQGAPEPVAQTRSEPETQIAPEPEAPNDPAALTASESADGKSGAGSGSEPTKLLPEKLSAADPAESAATAQPAAVKAAPVVSHTETVAATPKSSPAAQRAAAALVGGEPAAPVTMAVVGAAQHQNGPPADHSPTGSLPNESTAAVDVAPRPSAATATQAALSTELRVVLPQKRPAAADAQEHAKPARHRQRTHIRKAKAQQPARPLTFLDLLFGPPPNQNPQMTTVQRPPVR